MHGAYTSPQTQGKHKTKHDYVTWARRHADAGEVSIVAHFEVRVDGVVIG